MKVVIAVDIKKGSLDYDLWYLEYGKNREIRKVSLISKQELIEELFKDIQSENQGSWKAFVKEKDYPVTIEAFDFIAMNVNENTHFGNLPTIEEFKPVIEDLRSSLTFKSAS